MSVWFERGALVGASLTLSCISLMVAIYSVRKLSSLNKRACLPRRILLIRHGESEGNVREDSYQTTPDPQVPLSVNGREQCEALGKRLKDKLGNSPVWVYVSQR